ncbi:MAG: LysR family transcriptional regulator [Deltaproteobacteria bacterium]|nr:LysR family transcriptional regulator [Deltaproteobacteria bacterium]
MDVRNLTCFVEVVRRGGFSRAGEALHLTQPAVSKAVKGLEEELGQPLLLRAGRRVTLTDAGRGVYDRALAVLAGLRAIAEEVAEVGQVKRGTVRVGVPPMVGAVFFPPVLHDFRGQYPGVTLEMREEGARRIEALLLDGELDAGATVLPADGSDFELLPLLRDVLCAVLPPRSPLARQRRVALGELREVPLVLYRADFALHGHILDACRREGFAPRVAAESSQWDFMAEMVAADVGAALLPRTVCRRLDPARVKVLPLAEPALRWDLALAWRRGQHLTPAARAFVEVVRAEAARRLGLRR